MFAEEKQKNANSAMNNKDQLLITAIQNWLKTVIIEYGICPFAKRELDRDSIRFSINHNTEIQSCLMDLMDECDRLDSDSSVETSLLIYDNAFRTFDDYLDFLELAETLLIDQEYEGIYQLASFHPDYCFEGAEPDDPANYTNRSPYPMLHLIREASIERAVATFPHPETIPIRNTVLTRELGLAKMQALLSACYPLSIS